MNADAMATRMSVLTRALPSRILVVDDDELEAELMTRRLISTGFEVACASNGKEALEALERHWYPLVITDWQMPVMDGIAFTKALRLRGVEDTYVIMLSMREASDDYERGYVAGVDDYLSKRVSDAELLVRIHAAFNILALRRSLRQAQAALEQSVAIDAESGAFASSEVHGKLLGELRRAQRYGRQLAVLTLGVHMKGAAAGAAVPSPGVLRGVVQAIDSTLRAHVDWVSRIAVASGAAFAIVLPETGICEAQLIKDRLLLAVRSYVRAQQLSLELTFGVAALERSDADSPAVDAQEMLQVAGHCRACAGRTGPEQLSAVQRSVACHVAIVCRHGYAIDSECSLKGAAAESRAAASSSAIVD